MCAFRHWRWHLDEMYVKLNGEMVYLWQAVDHEGEVLESYVTRKRDKAAALTFMRKALRRRGSPEAITTDGLRSYRAATNERHRILVVIEGNRHAARDGFGQTLLLIVGLPGPELHDDVAWPYSVSSGARYSSSVTFSIQVTGEPFTDS